MRHECEEKLDAEWNALVAMEEEEADCGSGKKESAFQWAWLQSGSA
jgi:hypothetical protein